MRRSALWSNSGALTKCTQQIWTIVATIIVAGLMSSAARAGLPSINADADVYWAGYSNPSGKWICVTTTPNAAAICMLRRIAIPELSNPLRCKKYTSNDELNFPVLKDGWFCTTAPIVKTGIYDVGCLVSDP